MPPHRSRHLERPPWSVAGRRAVEHGGAGEGDATPSLEVRALTRARQLAGRWGLTPRQTAVLARLATGETNRTIAAELSCAESTVEQHVTAILEKVGCSSRVELVARFWAG